MVEGSWTDHPNFGRQFKAERAQRQMPSEKQGIYRYLASGVIKGIGPKTAEDIVATVIEYINKRDSEGLIALFCEEVKENYELTADVDILFNMFDGEITSYEVSAVASGEKSELFGKSSYSITGIVEAYVDDKEYRIEVSKTIYNDQKPQRVGITTVMAKDVNVKGMFFVGEVNVFYR